MSFMLKTHDEITTRIRRQQLFMMLAPLVLLFIFALCALWADDYAGNGSYMILPDAPKLIGGQRRLADWDRLDAAMFSRREQRRQMRALFIS